jgi:MYXO-CTERM domain-containing protein
MSILPARIAPWHIVYAARMTAPFVAALMGGTYAVGSATPQSTSALALLLGLLMLAAVPRRRAGELLGVAAAWMTLAEFCVASQTGQMQVWRWAMSIAALGIVVVPLKIQHLRILARREPYRRLADRTRRRHRREPTANARRSGSALRPAGERAC